MAKMIGKLLVKDWCGYGCCTSEKSKHTVKREELALAMKDAEAEMAEDTRHARGICFDPVTNTYGCDACYDDSDYNPPEDLDGIPNVLYNGKEPPKIDFSTL